MSYRLVKLFKKNFELLETKYGPEDKMYVKVDIHETIMRPTHTVEMSTEFYPHALKALKFMSEHPRICLIIWTSTLPETTLKYVELFKKHDINFDYVNSNPEIASTEYADFSTKFFMNVLLDDKAGFNAETDWEPLSDYFELLSLKDFLRLDKEKFLENYDLQHIDRNFSSNK